MKFSQDMMVYNPFPSLNPVKKHHETDNDKKERETPFISGVRRLLLKWLALYLFHLNQCKLYSLF